MAEHTYDTGTERAGPTTGTVLNMAGAVVSLGLMIGVGVWGYGLVIRDVSGVPVVRAMDGPMRRAPENPGGEVALHTGLSVNEVAAEGGASAPEDILLLAPTTAGLTEEDLTAQPTAEAGEEVLAEVPVTQGVTVEDEVALAVAEAPAAPVAPAPVPAAPLLPEDGQLTAEQILALADQIASGTTPTSDTEVASTAPVETAADAVPSEVPADIIPATVPGVAASLRPALRPANLAAVAPAQPPVDQSAPDEVIDPVLLISTEVVPEGTSLAQLGAFDSPEIAAQEWRRLNGRFTDFFAGKDRLIQEAERGGRTFYRLRARGFDDLADARRFCAALMAESADCVPVAVR